MNNRRQFFKKAGTGFLVLGVSPSFLVTGHNTEMKTETTAKKEDLFKVGIAGWTFNKFGLEPSLEMMDRVNVRYLSIKNFHLPFNSTVKQIAEFHDKLKAKRVTGYAVGPIGMDTEAEVDVAFDYAKRVGVKLILGTSKILPYVGKKVKEYDFRFAIHNEGGPTLHTIYAQIKDLDTRIGFCHDIGYSMQSGLDPVELTLKYGDRIYDMHIKDVTEISAKGEICLVGRGAFDFASLIRVLRKVKYSGKCNIEYELNPADPLAGIAEEVGYFRGVIDTV